MQIKKFEAKNMAGALRRIRNEFGENAVILSARTLKKEKGIFGAVRSVGVEVTAAKDALPEKGAAASADEVKDVFTRSSHGAYPVRQAVNAGRNFTPVAEHGAVSRVKKMPVTHAGTGSLTARLMSVKKDLNESGVENRIASKLIEAMSEHTTIKDNFQDEDLRSGLLGALETSGLKGEAIRASQEKGKVVVLVGGPGDGKTETIAKLAAAHLRTNEHSVAIVSLDCNRVAANAQLKTYAKIFGLPFAGVSDAPQLVTAIDEFKNRALVLVDTPGLTEENRDGLLNTLKNARISCRMEIYPVVNVMTREDLSMEMLRTVQALSPDGMVFSKVDACKPLGAMLNVMISSGVPVCHYTCGQRVPEDLGNDCLEMLAKGLFPQKTPAREKENRVRVLDTQKNNTNKKSAVETQQYVASANSDVFHLSDCKLARKIKKNNRINLKDAAEARQRQLIPCGFCMARPSE